MRAPQVWDLREAGGAGLACEHQSNRLGSLQLMAHGSAGMIGDGQGSRGHMPGPSSCCSEPASLSRIFFRDLTVRSGFQERGAVS